MGTQNWALASNQNASSHVLLGTAHPFYHIHCLPNSPPQLLFLPNPRPTSMHSSRHPPSPTPPRHTYKIQNNQVPSKPALQKWRSPSCPPTVRLNSTSDYCTLEHDHHWLHLQQLAPRSHRVLFPNEVDHYIHFSPPYL